MQLKKRNSILTEKDVQDILGTAGWATRLLTDLGWRYGGPGGGPVNNILAGIDYLQIGFTGKFKFPHLGCGQQAVFVGSFIDKLKLQDGWIADYKFDYLSKEHPLDHQWIEYRSLNPTDPLLLIDPWNGIYKKYSRDGKLIGQGAL